jgi:hypothetical protein
MKVMLSTAISAAECRDRLNRHFEKQGGVFASTARINGRFSRGKLYLYKQSDNNRNAFSPIFVGRITEEETGTVIRGGFRLSDTIIFILGFCGLFLIYASISTRSVLPVCLTALITAFAGLGYAIGEGDRREIVDFLQTILEASSS